MYNTQQKDVTVNVYTDGSHLQPEVLNDLANVIKLDANQVTFTKDELTKNIKAAITLPSTISIAGIHELRLGVSEKVTNDQGINVIVANEVRVLINATQSSQGILGSVPSETIQTPTTIKQTSQETRKKLNLADYILIIFANIILIVIVASIIYFFLKIKKRHKDI